MVDVESALSPATWEKWRDLESFVAPMLHAQTCAQWRGPDKAVPAQRNDSQRNLQALDRAGQN